MAAIALGCNLVSAWGDRTGTLREAVRRVGRLGRVLAVSRFRDTEPVGLVDQPRFLNGAMLLETDLPPSELLASLLAIEASMGRVRTVDKGPRTIDLDLLLYGDQVLSEPGLTVPHPAMQHRRFVLEPLAEIAPGTIHPVLRVTASELLSRLSRSDLLHGLIAKGDVS